MSDHSMKLSELIKIKHQLKEAGIDTTNLAFVWQQPAEGVHEVVLQQVLGMQFITYVTGGND